MNIYQFYLSKSQKHLTVITSSLSFQQSICLVVRIAGRLGGLNNKNDNNNQSHHEDFELPLLDLLTLTNATDNFSFANKIGEGGFGQVYKVVTFYP